ncbi:MAG TPA: hypothetical protein VF755_02060 [Catenuloplanes sp.]|jgi:hypothetical protein
MQAQRSTDPHQPTEPVPIAQVNTGMRVIDAAGNDLGTVTEVRMPGTGDGPDLPADDAARLLRAGYLRVDGGVLARDTFVAAGQVAEVTEGGSDAAGVVSLSVVKDELTRAG